MLNNKKGEGEALIVFFGLCMLILIIMAIVLVFGVDEDKEVIPHDYSCQQIDRSNNIEVPLISVKVTRDNLIGDPSVITRKMTVYEQKEYYLEYCVGAVTK